MNIETKVVEAYSWSDYDGRKEEYLKFGWEHTEDTKVKRGRGYKDAYVLVRDKSMPNYDELVKLENDYFRFKRQKRKYEPMEFGNVVLAFVLLIIPGIIYVSVKWSQKKKIKENNAELQRKMDAVVKKAEVLF